MSYNIYGEIYYDGHTDFGFGFCNYCDCDNDHRTEINSKNSKYVIDGYSFGTATEAVNYLMSDGMTYDEAIAYLENEGGAF